METIKTSALLIILLCSLSSAGQTGRATIIFEKNPWFTFHDMPLTIDDLLDEASAQQKLRKGYKQYRTLYNEKWEKPECDIDACPMVSDYRYEDIYCVILFNERDHVDTLAVLASGKYDKYLINGRMVVDREYGKSLVKFLCRKDKVFAKSTKDCMKLIPQYKNAF